MNANKTSQLEKTLRSVETSNSWTHPSYMELIELRAVDLANKMVSEEESERPVKRKDLSKLLVETYKSLSDSLSPSHLKTKAERREFILSNQEVFSRISELVVLHEGSNISYSSKKITQLASTYDVSLDYEKLEFLTKFAGKLRSKIQDNETPGAILSKIKGKYETGREKFSRRSGELFKFLGPHLAAQVAIHYSKPFIRNYVNTQMPELGGQLKTIYNLITDTPANRLEKDVGSLDQTSQRTLPVEFKLDPDFEQLLNRMIDDMRSIGKDYNSYQRRLEEAFTVSHEISTDISSRINSTVESYTSLSPILKELQMSFEEFTKSMVLTYAKSNMPNAQYEQLQRDLITIEGTSTDLGKYLEHLALLRKTHSFQGDAAQGLDYMAKSIEASIQDYTRTRNPQVFIALERKLKTQNPTEAIESVTQDLGQSIDLYLKKLDRLERVIKNKDENYVQELRDTYWELQQLREKMSGPSDLPESEQLALNKSELSRYDMVLQEKFRKMDGDTQIRESIGVHDNQMIARQSTPYDGGQLAANVTMLGSAALNATIIGYRLYQKGKRSIKNLIGSKLT